MQDLENKFESDLVRRAEKVRASKPLVELPPRRSFVRRSQSPASQFQVAIYGFILNVFLVVFTDLDTEMPLLKAAFYSTQSDERDTDFDIECNLTYECMQSCFCRDFF